VLGCASAIQLFGKGTLRADGLKIHPMANREFAKKFAPQDKGI
jgi:hypothetical protein